MGLYPLFPLGLKHFFLRHYDFFSFINFPNVLESINEFINGCKLIMKLFCGLGFSLHVVPAPRACEAARRCSRGPG